jgi:type IV pilus assembly protein PilX
MLKNARWKKRVGGVRRERGAVLYVAMIMLILLALIGIVGMQVAGLQERMSSNYRSENLAFQNAEAVARRNECALEDLVNRTATPGCGVIAPEQVCDNNFDAGAWADALDTSAGSQFNARLIGPCIAGFTAIDMGAVKNEDPNPVYQLTVYATDRPSNPSADASIDTIFRP